MIMYRIARPSQYLAITGAGIDDVKLAKKAWILPGQSCTVLDLTPVNYNFEVRAMSAEKVPFALPAVFTIGPPVDDPESILKYAKLISPHGKLSNHVMELVQGIVEAEVRVLAASMTMEEVFTGTKAFKQQVLEKVGLELYQFGLRVYNANVRQLVDVPGHEYFSNLGQKTQIEANQVSVVVAEAKAKIDSMVKVIAIRRAEEDEMRRIKVKTEVKVFENEREAEVAEANCELAKKKAAWTKETRVAEVEATNAVTLREAELQVEFERMNALTTTEKLKGQYKIKIQEVEYQVYKKMAEAEAQKALADATFYARKQAAEAELYAKKKDAEGIAIVGKAIDTLGNNYSAVRDYLIINGPMFQAEAMAKAEANVKAEVYVNKIVRLVFGLIAVILVIVVLIKLMGPASEAWLVVKR